MKKIMAFGFGLTHILVLISLIFAFRIEHFLKQNYENDNIFLFGVGAIIISVLWRVCRVLSKRVRNFDRFIIACSIILFILQVGLAYAYYTPINRGDVGVVVTDAIYLANNRLDLLNNHYFSIYPNNLFIVQLFSIVIKIANFVGYSNGYFALVIFQAFLYSLSGYLLFKLLKSISITHLALLGYFIYFVLMGLSVYVAMPYSDSVGIPILIILVTLVKKVFDGDSKKLFVLLGVLSGIAYKLKPQFLFVLMAFIVMMIFSHKTNKIYKITLSMTLFIATVFTINLITDNMGYQLNKEKAFPMIHWLAMGHNESREGSYYPDDVAESLNITDKQERSVYKLKVLKERVINLGFPGIFWFYIRKNMATYNDGAFRQFIYGIAFPDDEIPTASKIKKEVRSIFSVYGENYELYVKLLHSVWLILFLLATLSIFVVPKNTFNMVLYNVLTLLFVYQTLFEAGARYLYSYVPVYIMLAILGVHAFEVQFRAKREIQVDKQEK